VCEIQYIYLYYSRLQKTTRNHYSWKLVVRNPTISNSPQS